jgi:hypothetical protein
MRISHRLEPSFFLLQHSSHKSPRPVTTRTRTNSQCKTKAFLPKGDRPGPLGRRDFAVIAEKCGETFYAAMRCVLIAY